MFQLIFFLFFFYMLDKNFYSTNLIYFSFFENIKWNDFKYQAHKVSKN